MLFRSYLASIGMFAIIGFLLDRLRLSVDRPQAEKAVSLLVALMLCAFLLVTFTQGRVWSSTEAMYRNVLRFYPDSVMAQTNLGLELQLKGNLAEAREHYERAMQLDPHSVHAYFNLAALENKEGHPAEAEKLYVAIIDASGPDQVMTTSDVRPFLWLINRLTELGRPDDAKRLLDKLQALAPAQLQQALEKQKTLDADKHLLQ